MGLSNKNCALDIYSFLGKSATKPQLTPDPTQAKAQQLLSSMSLNAILALELDSVTALGASSAFGWLRKRFWSCSTRRYTSLMVY